MHRNTICWKQMESCIRTWREFPSKELIALVYSLKIAVEYSVSVLPVSTYTTEIYS